MLMVFAAVALGGWTMLAPGLAAHGLGAAAASLVVLCGVRLHRHAPEPTRFDNELRFRGDAHRDADAPCCDDPEVQARGCAAAR